MTRAALTAAVAAACVVVTLAFASGGYFPSDWGLILLGFALVLLGAAAAGERLAFGLLDAILLSALAALAAWQVLSAAWSPGPDGPVLEAERTLVYLTAAAAVLVALRRELVGPLLAGLAAGIVVVASLALGDRLLAGELGDPADPVSGIRLDDPIGYANAVGILVVLGGLLIAAFALRAPPYAAAAAGAALVPLASALAFTFSRGALVGLAAGVVALGLLEWERGRAFAGFVLLAAAPSVAALLSLRSPLADSSTTPAAADAAGERLLWQLALLCVGGAALGALLKRAARVLAPYAVAAAGLGALAAVAVVVFAGPRSLVDDALDRVRAEPAVTGSDVPGRLLSLSSTGRTAYWRVAWGMVERSPLTGEGAASYERWWLQERPVAAYARDAHNLYLETLAELGPVGLGLLLVALATPLAALRTRVRHPATPAAGAAYGAYLVHAALDWDWEIPVVTLVALTAGTSLIVLARTPEAARAWTRRLRAVALAGVSLLAVVALVAHVGNRAAAESEAALARADVSGALRSARRARTWQPWAAAPDRLRGEAELSVGHDVAAVRSLRDAIRGDPESWRAWYDLAVVTTGAERSAALRRAAKLNPLSPEVEDLRAELAAHTNS
jgi:O-Antigen ligase